VKQQVLAILRGSLRQQLRDPLTLLSMIVLPVLLNPLVLVVGGRVQAHQASELRAAVLTVQAPPAFAAAVNEKDRLVVVDEGWLEDGSGVLAQVVLARDDQPAEIHFRATRKRSERAKKRAERVLRRLRSDHREQLFQDAAIDGSWGEVLQVEERDLSTAQEREGGLLGRLLPMILVFIALNGGVITALDLVTGERERGTLETLLTARVDRRAVLLGKFSVVVLVALVTSALAVASLWLTLALGLYEAPGEGLGIPAAALPVLLVLLVPLSLLMASIFTVVAAYVPDYRTGQLAALVLIFAAWGASGVTAFPAVTFSPALALVPVTNLALAMRAALVGSFPPFLLALTLGATALHVGVALLVGSRLLARETVLLGAASASDRRARGRFGPDVAGIFLLSVILLWFLGQRVQSLHLLWGMLFTQLVLMGGLALGALVWLGQPLRATLQLRRPKGSDLLLAVMAGVTAPGLSALVAAVQQPLLPVSKRMMETMEASLQLEASLPVVVLVFALLPALCEELLFRGTLLNLLRRSLGPLAACLVVGLLFGAIHLHLVRLLPTATFGVLLAWAALRSGSIWVPITMHALHNGLLLLLATQGFGQQAPAGLLVGLSVLCVASVLIMDQRAHRR